MTAFFALFIFAGIFNCFNARTYRINLLAHIRKNPMFILIMAAVAAIQLLLIYYGGSLFRTAGLTFIELIRVIMIAFLVVPVDCIRKLVLRLFGRKDSLNPVFQPCEALNAGCPKTSANTAIRLKTIDNPPLIV